MGRVRLSTSLPLYLSTSLILCPFIGVRLAVLPGRIEFRHTEKVNSSGILSRKPASRLVVGNLLTGCPTPVVDLSEMWPVIMGMLGLGTMRSIEKVNGRAK